MGFFRKQEENLAERFLRWQYEKAGREAPGEADLRRHAARIVDEAHRIARERGGNLLDIMRELAREFFRRDPKPPGEGG